MEKDIKIFIRRNAEAAYESYTAPADMGLSLMEFLKAMEIPVKATCGGMALCATCHVTVDSESHVAEPNDEEYAMLDTLPEIYPTSRLSCQIRLDENAEGLHATFRGELE